MKVGDGRRSLGTVNLTEAVGVEPNFTVGLKKIPSLGKI